MPMLDVGDFEVLDECVDEDEMEELDIRSCDGSYYDDEDEEDQHHHENPKRKTESMRRKERGEDMDENSADNGDNVLDVSIGCSENEFLESVAKDFSENIEEQAEERPKTRSSARLTLRREPAVQVKKVEPKQKKVEDDTPEVVAIVPFKKKPGPKSKTMNVQVATPAKTQSKTPPAKVQAPQTKAPATVTPARRPIQRINFSDNKKENDNANTNAKKASPDTNKTAPNANKAAPVASKASPVTTKAAPVTTKATPVTTKPAPAAKVQNNQAKKTTNAQQKTVEQAPEKVQQKTPAFLKKDLTDEEIMEHFDEIENTVVTSESFMENETDEVVKEDEEDDEVKIIEEKTDDTKEKAEEDEEEVKELEEVKEVEEIKEVEIVKEEEDKEEEEEVKVEENKVEEKKDDEENWDAQCDANPKKPHIKIEEENFAESEMWYKEKIKAKERVVEEKFTKLAKIIQYSYPMYKKWLDRNESLFGTAICKVESSKHSPLDQLHPNRWKFMCIKKVNQPSKEEEKQAEDTSENKNVQSCWEVIPGVADANVDNAEEYPQFVMRVVKVFEDFLNSIENENKTNESGDGAENSENASENKQDAKTTNKSEADNEKANETDKSSIKNLEGLTLLLRCNRREELMMHITGKNISDDFMDKIKDYFENGNGKECNVKSLYCKTIIRENNVIKTNNTFLSGSETLDDILGGVRIQLAPKTTVWANLAGVEVLSNVVTEYLNPSKKTTIIEIGCGTGLISLLLASKCQKIIGVDIQKEIVEAEITCELNEIKNATFVTGKPKVVMSQIDKVITNSNAVAVINTNNTFGRSLEVITALRKMSTLGRIVIITTLTKQAIRSILELTQPADEIYGNPFIPIKACIVDTTPKHFGFDIIMSMERRTMQNLLLKSSSSEGNSTTVGLVSKSKQMAAKYNANVNAPPSSFNKKGVPLKFVKGFKAPPAPPFTGKKTFFNPPPSKFQGKRPYPGSDANFAPGGKKFKQFDKPWQGPSVRPNLAHDDGDLRDRLSGRSEPVVIAQEMHEQKKLLDAAKQKLTSTSVDVNTVKKLQEMLSLAIEKTNKLQSQLPPRSVWDRIAPADYEHDEEPIKPSSSMRGGRHIKETGPKDIIITTSNSRDYNVPPSKSKKYNNLPPLEPNQIMPLSKPERLKMTSSVSKKPNTAPYQKPGPNRFQSGTYRKQESSMESGWNQQPPVSKWNARPSPPRRSSPPRAAVMRPAPIPRQSSPPRRPVSPQRRPVVSPPRRPVASPPRRPAASPPRRPVASPPRRPVSPVYRHTSSSSSSRPGGARPLSPPPRKHSPPRRPISPAHHYRNSPPRQATSSRQKSPPPARRYADEWDIPTRGAVVESGWGQRPEKEKWPSTPSSTGWNQQSSSGSKYQESDSWDKPSGTSSWNSRKPSPPPPSSSSSSANRWKGSSASNNASAGSKWDVGKKKSTMPDMGSRQESRHEPQPRHEPRHEPRWESQPPPSDKYRNDKDDWGDLPEDARDPWGDDHPPAPPPKEIRWNNQPPSQQSNQSSSSSSWNRDKIGGPPAENWQNKPSYPMSNNMSGGGMPPPGNMQPGGMGGMGMNPNMHMNMGGGMNNKPMWPPQQQQQPQPNRNVYGMPPNNNWQGGGSNSAAGIVAGLLGISGPINNWQPPQQQQQQQQQPNFSNYPPRPFNNNPYRR